MSKSFFSFETNNNNTNEDDNNINIGDKELVNVVWKNENSVATSNGQSNQSISKEYGYQYEYGDDPYDDDDDDDDDNDEADGQHTKNGQNETPNFFQKIIPKSNHTAESNDPNQISYSIHLLGKIYHPILDYSLRREDETNLLWFSYRCDFPEIKPDGITSDAGWGCMLRSAQMLLSQALRVHYCGREWKAPRSTVQRRSDAFMQDLSMWFADFPSVCTGCWYSLHNMVACGVTKYDIMPGEWFGPGIACHVMRDLTELHERGWKKLYQHKDHENDKTIPDSKSSKFTANSQSTYQRNEQPVMRVYVAQEGSIYRNDIKTLMTKDQRNQNIDKKTDVQDDAADDEEYHKVDFDALVEDPLLHLLSESPEDREKKREVTPWDTSLLILIPLRLGLKTFNASTYKVPLSHVLSFSQSVGFVGGAPRHALWFYGSNSDGSKVYGLDPHTVQRAPRRRRLRPEEKQKTGNTKQYQVQLTDEYLRSFNCPSISSYDIAKIDPSLALGFYCKDEADFESLCSSLDEMKTKMETKDYPQLFSVADTKPDYNADLSSAMMDMMMGNSQMDEDIHAENDEDDFVML